MSSFLRTGNRLTGNYTQIPSSASSYSAPSSTSPATKKDSKDNSSGNSTPLVTRKARRRSNLFPPFTNNKNKALEEKMKNGELGIGREIPVKQGFLYKKSKKALNKDWKKKWVTIKDGFLTYHSTLQDYQSEAQGKSIPLKHTTVKIPGQKPRGSRPTQGSSGPSSLVESAASDLENDLNNLHLCSAIENDRHTLGPNSVFGKESSHQKKRHRRSKSNNKQYGDGVDDSDTYEFIIVSLDNKQWHFEASSCDEREEWVTKIEEEILNSLQEMESDKSKYRISGIIDRASVQTIREVAGNSHCVDCNKPNPDWTSFNLGALICIECSGIHRNLGTHISRVRSLDLDDWPPGHVSVMKALGNSVTNSIYEFNIKGLTKPIPSSSRDEKEKWIRSKYEKKEFLAPLDSLLSIGHQLMECISSGNVPSVAKVLAHLSSPDQINSSVRSADGKYPLHIAASIGSLAIVQLLIWNNAKVDVIDRYGQTALQYAMINGHKDIADLLIQHGCSPLTGTTGIINGSHIRRRPRVTSMASLAMDVFDKLPASII